MGKKTVVSSTAYGYDTPFGRFTTPNSVLSVNGIKSWIVMELISPLTFLFTTYLHPFSPMPLPLPSLALVISPQFILVTLYLIHYLNHTLISPLHSPSRFNTSPYTQTMCHQSQWLAPCGGRTAHGMHGFLIWAMAKKGETHLWLTRWLLAPCIPEGKEHEFMSVTSTPSTMPRGVHMHTFTLSPATPTAKHKLTIHLGQNKEDTGWLAVHCWLSVLRCSTMRKTH